MNLVQALWNTRLGHLIRVLQDLSASVGLKSGAGRMTVAIDVPLHDRYIYFHFLPYEQFRLWGYKRDHYDGTPLQDFGLGPLLLVCCQGFDWFGRKPSRVCDGFE